MANGSGDSESPQPRSSPPVLSSVAELGSAALNVTATLLLAKWHLITGMEALVALGLTGASMDPLAAVKRLLGRSSS